MTHYVYILKCPDCEDEFFDFFEDAKICALRCLSDKPIITQTEVNRNDFGECTDHCDLGTVWSWEEALGEPEEKCDDTVFSKADTFNCAECDPEFDNLDNSVDPEIDEISERKPIPEGMTIEELVEAMEENEDTVECAVCEELFPKTDGVKRGRSYVCPTCSKTDVDLAMANLVVDEFEAIDGYDDAEAAVANSDLPEDKQAEILDVIDHIREEEEEHIDELKELKTEDNTLSEDLGDTRLLEELVKDSINHLTNDLGKDPWADDFADDVIADLENNYDIYVPEDMAKYGNWCHNVASEVSRQVNKSDSMLEELEDAEAYRERLVTCPECGDKSYDIKLLFCINCGFNQG